MNREIKFRVWDNVDYMSNCFTLMDLQLRNMCFATECIVMQYTGLKDKNGKDIYEGDIVTFGNLLNINVVFDNGCFNVFDEPLGWDFDSNSNEPLKTDFKYCEVIGNIHENPELI